MDPETLTYYLAFVPTIVVAITFHEFAHARMALVFGDSTAYQQGRVTLNPLAHLDPIGTLGIFFAGFGWGRPVPVDPSRFRHRRADLLVSAAGPGTNLLLAVLAGLLLRIPWVLKGIDALELGKGAAILASVFVQTNLALAFFNFIPLGPLDGAHVLENLLPVERRARFRQFNSRYGYLLLLGLIASDYFLPVSILSLVLGPPIEFLYSVLLGG